MYLVERQHRKKPDLKYVVGIQSSYGMNSRLGIRSFKVLLQVFLRTDIMALSLLLFQIYQLQIK